MRMLVIGNKTEKSSTLWDLYTYKYWHIKSQIDKQMIK